MQQQAMENHWVQEAPKKVYYIPNFITEDEEEYLIKRINEAPKPKWTCLNNRRLQDYGGIPHKNGLIPEDIPTWLQLYMDRISDLNIFLTTNGILQANHCLINEYKPNQGIMPHFDGPVFTPVISTLNLGSHSVLNFYQEKESVRTLVSKLLLERRSLVVLKEDMYTKYLHGIDEVDKDVIDGKIKNLSYLGVSYKLGDELTRGLRLSLTIRNVPKVFSNNLFGLIKK